MYFPYLHVCLEQLCDRFSAYTAIAYAVSSLLPLYIYDTDMGSLRVSVEAYDYLIPGGADCFKAELMRWNAY